MAAHVFLSAVETYVHYGEYVHKVHDNVKKQVGSWAVGVAAAVGFVSAVIVIH